MENKIKKTFEVMQVIPSNTFVLYHVEAYDEQEAEDLVDNGDKSVNKISEDSQESEWGSVEYITTEL
jgi:hypothetical protein